MSTSFSANLVVQLNQFTHSLLVEDWAQDLLSQRQGKYEITIPFAANELVVDLTSWLKKQNLEQIQIKQQVASIKAMDKAPLDGVKNIILVSSAKGGVGKSTTAVNLALALQANQAKVGLLDADIYGPSLPTMLGTTDKRPETQDGKMMEPVMAHGLQTNSIGYLVADSEAMVWRGPMAAKAFSQLIAETRWQELDYLIIDMPPGTGDIQISLAQQFPVTAAIVVTTPQDLALTDAIKGVSMFNKVSVPVLGVVENMSYHICRQCGHQEDIFGSGGAIKMAQEFGISILAQMPLAMTIRQDIDNGCPSVIANSNSEYTRLYNELALNVASKLYWHGEVQPETIAINLL